MSSDSDRPVPGGYLGGGCSGKCVRLGNAGGVLHHHDDCPEHGKNRPGQGTCEPKPSAREELREYREQHRHEFTMLLSAIVDRVLAEPDRVVIGQDSQGRDVVSETMRTEEPALTATKAFTDALDGLSLEYRRWEKSDSTLDACCVMEKIPSLLAAPRPKPEGEDAARWQRIAERCEGESQDKSKRIRELEAKLSEAESDRDDFDAERMRLVEEIEGEGGHLHALDKQAARIRELEARVERLRGVLDSCKALVCPPNCSPVLYPQTDEEIPVFLRERLESRPAEPVRAMTDESGTAIADLLTSTITHPQHGRDFYLDETVRARLLTMCEERHAERNPPPKTRTVGDVLRDITGVVARNRNAHLPGQAPTVSIREDAELVQDLLTEARQLLDAQDEGES